MNETITSLDSKSRVHYQRPVRVFRALAHPTRLFIVEHLADGEHCVCELQAMIDADMSTVSKHLALLRSADLVQTEKRGPNVYYSLAPAQKRPLMICIREVKKMTAPWRTNR